MNRRSFLLVSSTMVLLSACTAPATPDISAPSASRPDETPGPTYTATTTATLTPAPGRAFGQFVAASAGDEGAIVYTESDEVDNNGVVRNLVVLQRLDATGAVSGPPVELDIVESKGYYSPPALTLATDGSRYLACWEREGSIVCAGVPVGEGPALPALSVNGAWPSLAYGSGTFALAYGVPEHVNIVRVASDGSAVGSPASFDTGEGTNPKAFLAATKSGFALMEGDGGGTSNVRVHQLDSDFAPIGPALDLGMQYWFCATMSASGANVAIGLAKPYGGQIFTLDGGTVTHNYEFSGGGKGGMKIALLANEATFDMLSTYGGPGLRYRAIQKDEVLASEQPLLTELYADGSALALMRLHGEMFLAATDTLHGSEITVTRLHRL